MIFCPQRFVKKKCGTVASQRLHNVTINSNFVMVISPKINLKSIFRHGHFSKNKFEIHFSHGHFSKNKFE